MTIKEAISALNQQAEDIDAAAAQTLRDAITFGLKTAIARSSGPFSQTALDSMDHPYAKRHGTAKLPPEIINSQTGAFREHWRSQMLSPTHGVITNEDPKADFLVGKKRPKSRMLIRPVDESVAKSVEAMLKTALPGRLKRVIY